MKREFFYTKQVLFNKKGQLKLRLIISGRRFKLFYCFFNSARKK